MAKADILAFMDAHKITIEATFVPWSKSRNKGEKSPSLNWLVTMKRNDRDVLTTDYSAGIGHTPAYKSKPPIGWDRPARMWPTLAGAWECENGKPVTLVSWDSNFRAKNGAPPITPDPCDVLSCLALDAGVLDAGGFEYWASDLGYDPDSRKAEAIYRECLEIALKLRAGLGDKGFSELREAASDY